uniref:Prenyltransferase PT4 n=1 Tax=Clematis terniflora TaxID=231663 RepID=A0A7S5AH25_CLETE|nr:prenyltransferase PT4 [Clematis terniflora]
MISSLASSSFTSTTCSSHQQGGFVRRLRPLAQIKGLSLKYQEPKNLLTFNLSKRSSTRISASLSQNLGKVDEPISENNNDSPTKVAYSATTTAHDGAFAPQSEATETLWSQISKKLDALYVFTRPYTIYGTIVGIISISLLPVQTWAELSPSFFFGLLKALIPTVLVNIYMCAINQLTDIEIDKINKPYLPLASGVFSLAEGTAITALTAMSALLLGAVFNSPPLLLGVMSIFFIATAYSVDLPLLRWKASAYLASLSIIGIRALTIPLCFFAHAQKYILGRPLAYSKPVFFTVAFMTIIATVIAIIKDLPDVEGDEAFGLRSPSSVYGREAVFWTCVYTLMATYAAAAAFGATTSYLSTKIITVLGHGLLSAILWTKAKSVNIKENKETLDFYLFIWKLLYAEYFVIPFFR